MRRLWIGVFTAALVGLAACGGSNANASPTPLSRAAAGKIFLDAKNAFNKEWFNYTNLIGPGSKATLADVQAEGKKLVVAINTFQQTLLHTNWSGSAKTAANALAIDATKFAADVSKVDNTQPLQPGNSFSIDLGYFFHDMDVLAADVGQGPTPSPPPTAPPSSTPPTPSSTP